MFSSRALGLASTGVLLAGLLIARRSPETRTFTEMRAVAAALNAYAADYHVYPAARSMDELARVLEPGYIQRLPRIDAWKEPYRYSVRTARDGKQSYRLASSGKDRRWECGDLWRCGGSDIVLADGKLMR